MCTTPVACVYVSQPLMHVRMCTTPVACVYVTLSGPDESSHTAEALTARAAQGNLTIQLHGILTALQACQGLDKEAAKPPQGFSSSRGSVVNPSALLSALAWHIPEGVLERGYQHDVAEALEVCTVL